MQKKERKSIRERVRCDNYSFYSGYTSTGWNIAARMCKHTRTHMYIQNFVRGASKILRKGQFSGCPFDDAKHRDIVDELIEKKEK